MKIKMSTMTVARQLLSVMHRTPSANALLLAVRMRNSCRSHRSHRQCHHHHHHHKTTPLKQTQSLVRTICWRLQKLHRQCTISTSSTGNTHHSMSRLTAVLIRIPMAAAAAAIKRQQPPRPDQATIMPPPPPPPPHLHCSIFDLCNACTTRNRVHNYITLHSQVAEAKKSPQKMGKRKTSQNRIIKNV
jgi:hypothetical protein